MDHKFMRISFSIIGNCVEFLRNSEQKLRSLFSGYEVSSKDNNLQDGSTVKSLMFTNKNISVRFLPERVDCTISAQTSDTPVSSCFTLACECFKKLETLNPQLKGNRIAIVAQGFVDNTQDKAIEYFTQKTGFSKAFGTSNELHFKINTPEKSFEPLNSVLNVDMGEAKNNKTGETIKVLLVSIDVNTLAANQTERFTLANIKPLFTKMLDFIEARLKELKKY